MFALYTNQLDRITYIPSIYIGYGIYKEYKKGILYGGFMASTSVVYLLKFSIC